MGFMQFNNDNGKDQPYHIRVMTRTINVAISQVVSSGPYKVSRQSFIFSRRFTVTKTFNKTLNQQGQYGKVISILVIPICILLDVLILVFGLTFGSILLLGIIIFFIFFVVFLLLKSIITNQ